MTFRHLSRTFLLILLAALMLSITGCKAIRPMRSIPVEEQAPLFIAPAFQPTTEPVTAPAENQEQGSSQPADCTNGLQFIFPDLTYPDGTQVSPGAALDKQWQVKNTGTCNWDETYTLRMVSGDAMSTSSPLALVPARNNTEAVIQILFTAPTEPGKYRSDWKAFDPNGEPFGDPLYIEIIVTP